MLSVRILIILIFAVGLSALAVSRAAGRPKILDVNQPRPNVDRAGFVSHTEEVTIGVPRNFLHKFQQSGPLESKLRGTNRIAGVDHVEMIRGTWGEPGARRLVIRKDGNQSLEEVLEQDPSNLFRYEVWAFTDRAGILTNYFVGEFRFRDVPGGTTVTWTYSFHRRFLLAQPILAYFVRSRITDFMHSAIERMKQESEEAYRGNPM